MLPAEMRIVLRALAVAFMAFIVGCSSDSSQARTPAASTSATTAASAPASARVTRASFGSLDDGRPVEIFTLTNSHGLELRAMTFGGTIVSLRVPDKNGALDDIVLGYDNPGSYGRSNAP